MQLHALHTLGLALELELKLPRQPQKAQRFIRFALLLSVKLFRKLFATENAKQINTATEVVLPLSVSLSSQGITSVLLSFA